MHTLSDGYRLSCFYYFLVLQRVDRRLDCLTLSLTRSLIPKNLIYFMQMTQRALGYFKVKWWSMFDIWVTDIESRQWIDNWRIGKSRSQKAKWKWSELYLYASQCAWQCDKLDEEELKWRNHRQAAYFWCKTVKNFALFQTKIQILVYKKAPVMRRKPTFSYFKKPLSLCALIRL